MKLDKWIICAVIVIGASTLAAAQEPLGDVARKERAKQKPQAAKVITNEDLPSVSPEEAGASAEVPETDETKPGKKGEEGQEGPASAQEKIKEMEQWKSRIAAQDAKVQLLDQQVTQLERDYKLRMSAFYSDLGLRLRDEAKWAEEEKKYHEEIAAKQKERDAERTKLDDLKEAARKAGVRGID